MLELLAIPAAVLCFITTRVGLARLQLYSFFLPGTGALLAAVATAILVRILGFPDLTTSDASPAFWYLVRSWVYITIGVLIGFAAGSAAALFLRRDGATQRPDFTIPWFGVGLLCCALEFSILLIGFWWLLLGFRRHVAPYLGAVDGDDAYNYISMFVILDVCFIFFPMMLVARVFAYAAAWSFYNDRRRTHAIPPKSRSIAGHLVFLRSFRIGRARRKLVTDGNLIAQWVAPWTRSFFQRWIGETYDEILRPSVERHFSNFVGIADPKSHLPNIGAESAYAQDSEWKRVAAEMITTARATLLLEGATAGLQWELTHVRERNDPTRIFIATLPSEFKRGRTSWCEFHKKLMHAGFNEVEDPGPGSIIGFDATWKPVRILSNASDCDMIAAAIAEWASPRDPKPNNPMHPSGGSAAS